MWKKNDDFSRDDLARLLSSPQARELARLLQQMDPSTLSKAADMAAQGNAAKAQALLSPLLKDPHVQDLVQGMEDRNG